MIKKQVNNLDIEPALNELERINKSIDFLGSALPDYKNEGGTEEVATILLALSEKAGMAINEIKKVAALV